MSEKKYKVTIDLEETRAGFRASIKRLGKEFSFDSNSVMDAMRSVLEEAYDDLFYKIQHRLDLAQNKLREKQAKKQTEYQPEIERLMAERNTATLKGIEAGTIHFDDVVGKHPMDIRTIKKVSPITMEYWRTQKYERKKSAQNKRTSVVGKAKNSKKTAKTRAKNVTAKKGSRRVAA